MIKRRLLSVKKTRIKCFMSSIKQLKSSKIMLIVKKYITKCIRHDEYVRPVIKGVGHRRVVFGGGNRGESFQ